MRLIRENLVNQMPNSISDPQESASNQKTTFAPVPLQQIQPIAQDKEFPRGDNADSNTLAGQGMLKLNQIFAIEAELNEVTATERKTQRLEQEKKLIEAFFVWAEGNRASVPSQSKIGKALDYAIRGKKSYMSYLEDGRINFTNSIAENAIRPFAVGRKNWLFSASPKGASASAAIYSLIETCKANAVDPYRYFVYILQRMPNEPFQIRPELLEDYLPWSQAVQLNCK